MASHDREFIQTVCNRIIELTPNGIIDKMTDYESYILDPLVKEQRLKMYKV
jgi:ATPase subunit of ABC transporter with duplicated ATPase domains